jgi:hypothetical protein
MEAAYTKVGYPKMSEQAALHGQPLFLGASLPEVREHRFSDFGYDKSDVDDEDTTCFNREWWRRCCRRMFAPARKENARHNRLIHEHITDTEPLKEHNTDELRRTFSLFDETILLIIST